MTSDCRRKQPTVAYLLFLFLSSEMTRGAAAGGTAASATNPASSFPAPLSDYNARGSLGRSQRNWNEGGGGGASSDDEGGEEDGMSSSEEFEDHHAEGQEPRNTLEWFPDYHHRNVTHAETHQSAKKKNVSRGHPANPSVKNAKDTKDNEQDDSPSPLQTIHRLRRMLDDTDYVTNTPTSRKSDLTIDPEQSRSNIPAEATDTAFQQPVVPQESNSITATETPKANDNPPPPSPPPASIETPTSDSQVDPTDGVESDDRLWTSKDRSKYKKVQRRSRRVSTPIFLNSDDEASDTEDGLGYKLSDVPVYFSDGEESEETESDYGEAEETPPLADTARSIPPPPPGSNPVHSTTTGSNTSPQTQTLTQEGYTPPLHTHPNNMYPYHNNDPQSAQQGVLARPYNPYLYGYPYTPYQPTYGPFLPPQQQQQQQQQYPYPHPYPQQWIPGGYTVPPFPPQYPRQQLTGPTSPSNLGSNPQLLPARENNPSQVSLSHPRTVRRGPFVSTSQPGVNLPATPFVMDRGVNLSGMAYPEAMTPGPSLAEAGSKISFDAIQKIGLMLVTVALACYAGVSPRSLPLTEYNLKFYENFRLVSLAFISPAIKFLTVFDASQNDVNDAVNTFFASFSLGYPMAFMLQVFATTLIRLAVFAWFEPKIFSLTPKVPMLVIPWTLRENRYRPKRITLLTADFCASCVASPIIEEYVKLKTLQWTTKLRKNFRWTAKKTTSPKNSKKTRRRWVAEPVPRKPGETDVITANQYVTQMLAASIGFKLCDAGRRILMYTKATAADKSFYAFCRGLFPIHELCGTMTAIELARRDLLGVNLPLWRLLFPAALIHGMANMRGKKPVFRWGSSTPWSEMQLSPLHVLDASTLPKILSKGFAKLMWLVLLSRVLGYCIKNYYLVNRRAVKRTTRYAGNHAAFSAEMATAEMLKKK